METYIIKFSAITLDNKLIFHFVSYSAIKNKDIAAETVQKYIKKSFDENFLLFTDGSVTAVGKVGAAVLVSSSFSINFPFEFTFRIPDGLLVYYSEAFAILQPLNIVKKYNLMKTLKISAW